MDDLIQRLDEYAAIQADFAHSFHEGESVWSCIPASNAKMARDAIEVIEAYRNFIRKLEFKVATLPDEALRAYENVCRLSYLHRDQCDERAVAPSLNETVSPGMGDPVLRSGDGLPKVLDGGPVVGQPTLSLDDDPFAPVPSANTPAS